MPNRAAADRAPSTLERYQVAHVTMAASAEMVVNMAGEGLLKEAEALASLRRHVDRYHAALAALDGQSHEVRA
ncbi:MAG: hypothetical protein WCG85_16000 [Polyangia bacterium]